MKALGLINARGGSKGVPRKNIRPLAGKPLIGYAIEAGLKAQTLSRIVVSTEDEEIANIAQQAGADVPFLRPAELASDKAVQIDAVQHAVSFLEADGDHYDLIVILQPTVPFRTSKDIDGTVELLQKHGADSAISVCDTGGYHPVTFYLPEQDSARIKPFLEADKAGVLRQNFPAVLWRNGAVYVTRRHVIMEERSLYGDTTVGYQMPPERSFNIDNRFDWDLAEAWITYGQANMGDALE